MTEETLDALRRLLYVPDLAGIGVARLQPGDVLIVEVNEKLTEHQGAELYDQLHDVWPEHKILICDDGVRLRIARELEEEDIEV